MSSESSRQVENITSNRPPEHAVDARKERRSPLTYIPAAMGGIAFSLIISNLSTLTYDMKAATSKDPLNQELSQIATEISGHTTYIECNDEPLDTLASRIASPSGTGQAFIIDGAVTSLRLPFGKAYAPPVATLRDTICHDIIEYNPQPPSVAVDSPEYAQYKHDTVTYAFRLAELIHEIQHTEQISNEAQANCYAYQKLPAALKREGVDPSLVEYADHEAAAQDGTVSPDTYLSPECTPHGQYDLGISDIYLKRTPMSIASLPLAPSES